MGEVKLESMDVAAETEALAKRQSEETAAFRKTRALGLDGMRKSLEGRPSRCAAALERIGEVERSHAKRMGEISANWRQELIEEHRIVIQRESLEKADALHLEIVAESKAAQLEATGFEPDRIRRRALFAKDPALEAQIRGTWIARLARMTPDGLLDLAEEARDVGNVALAGAIEEELGTRGGLDSGSQAERKTAAAIWEAINDVELPELARAKAALFAVKSAEREAAERCRMLRGGRPGGLSSIREGLLQRQQGAR